MLLRNTSSATKPLTLVIYMCRWRKECMVCLIKESLNIRVWKNDWKIMAEIKVNTLPVSGHMTSSQYKCFGSRLLCSQVCWKIECWALYEVARRILKFDQILDWIKICGANHDLGLSQRRGPSYHAWICGKTLHSFQHNPPPKMQN